jgi:hypothetical protein
MKRLLTAIVISAVGIMDATQMRGAQRATGDQAGRLARATHETTVGVIMADRRSRCMNSIGSGVFCDCLNGALPLATDFLQYIRVTTAQSVASLSANDRKLAEVILAVRDQCVSGAFPTPK